MKKNLLLFLLLCCLTVSAITPIIGFRLPLFVQVLDPTNSSNPFPRTPVRPPTVGMDGHTLYFETDHPSFTLVLLDEEGEEVYSAVAPSDVDSVTLPSTLTGDYELQLYDGSNYYYYCEITF